MKKLYKERPFNINLFGKLNPEITVYLSEKDIFMNWHRFDSIEENVKHKIITGAVKRKINSMDVCKNT